MTEMAKQFKDIFMFFFPIILFSPSGNNYTPSQQTLIMEHQLYYNQQLEKYIFFHGNGDEEFVAIKFGIANDLIRRLQEL